MSLRNLPNRRPPRRTTGAVTRRTYRRQRSAPLNTTLHLSAGEVRLLAQIASAASSSMPSREVLGDIAPALRRLVAYDRMVVFLAMQGSDAMELFFQAGITMPGGPTGYVESNPRSVISHVVKTREPWLNSHIDQSTVTRFPTIWPSIEAGVRSWLAVPLLAADTCIGVLQLQSLAAGAYDSRHVRLMQMVSGHIASALFNRVSAEKMRMEAQLARTLVEERARVAELGQIIHASPQLDEVYKPFAEKLQQLIPWDGITVVMRSEDTGEWELRLDEGVSVPDARSIRGGPGDRSFTSYVLEQTRPQIISIQTDREARETIARFPALKAWVERGVQSLLSTPLIIMDRAIGVLHLRSLQAGAYSERHTALIEQIAIYVASAVNNAELTRRQTEHTELRAAIAEIGNAVISSLNIEEVYPRFVGLVRKVIPWDRIIVNSLHDGDTSFREQYWAGIAVSGRQPGDIVQLAGTFTERVLSERRPVMMSLKDEADVAAAEREFPGLRLEIKRGFRSFLTAPLFSNEGLIGTFSMRSLQSGAYTAEHVQLIEQVGAHLATAMANAELHTRLAREAEEKTRIAQLGRILSSSADLNTVLPEFFDMLRQLLPADRLVITVIGAEQKAHEDRYILGKRIPGWDGNIHRSLSTLVVQQVLERRKGRLVLTPEIASVDPAEQPGLAASYAAGLKSAIFAPLISGGKVIGTINLKSEKEDAYTPADLDLLERIAQQVAGNVQVAENFGQVLAAASDRERRLRAEAERENLERQAEEKSRFITQVGHELRTPLTTVLAFADILRRNRAGNLTDDQLEKLVVMQRNGRRLATLVDDLLDLSRIEQGSYILRPEQFDLAQFVRRVATDARPVVAGRGQKLKVDAPRKTAHAYGDQQRLTQVLLSLITNASSYSPEDSTITLSATSAGDEIEIAVSDEGSGIPDKDHERIFDLFYRVDNEVTRSVPGTGIGLYVAKTLVEAHGGKIAVDGSYRDGARIVITLPLKGGAIGGDKEQAA